MNGGAVLRISEVFGPVWQGEGRQAGQVCTFVRVSGCNLSCAWCDTPYTWSFNERRAEKHNDHKVYDIRTERQILTVAQVAKQVRDLESELVVISGGEPLLQVGALTSLVHGLVPDFRVAFETAGTRSPGDLRWVEGIQWTVSPKLSGSGNKTVDRYQPDVIQEFVEMGADFKFVISNATDMEEAHQYQQNFRIPKTRMWAMAEGTLADAVLTNSRGIAEDVSLRGWNFTLRQHTLLYGNERGR